MNGCPCPTERRSLSAGFSDTDPPINLRNRSQFPLLARLAPLTRILIGLLGSSSADEISGIWQSRDHSPEMFRYHYCSIGHWKVCMFFILAVIALRGHRSGVHASVSIVGESANRSSKSSRSGHSTNAGSLLYIHSDRSTSEW